MLVLDRPQQHMQLATFDLSCFVSCDKSCDQETLPVVIYEEYSEDWINVRLCMWLLSVVMVMCVSEGFVLQVNDHLQFLSPSPSHPVRVLLSTAQSGHTHLALVQRDSEGGVSTRHITSGDWSLLGSKVTDPQRLVLIHVQVN